MTLAYTGQPANVNIVTSDGYDVSGSHPLAVSGSVTASGTVTANIGTSGSLALDASVTSLSGKLPAAAAAQDTTSNPTVSQIEGMNMVFNGSSWDRARGGLVGAQSSATGMQNILSTGRYNATPPSLSDGQFINLQLNSEGDCKTAEQFAPAAEDNTNGVIAVAPKPLATNTYAPSQYANFAGSVTGAAIKNSPGNIFSILATNANGSVRYLQLHNATAKPAGGAVPVMVFPIPASGSVTVGEFFTRFGVYFSTGITWTVSTTVGTFTDSATASEHTVHAVYK